MAFALPRQTGGVGVAFVRRGLRQLTMSSSGVDVVTSALLYLCAEPWHDPTQNWRYP